ncbi:efflux RND transporter periplasmic adaptor subunit [Enterovirga aerilata]|uniref:Efflux RND transporter periplasmic adaptor subunit n=1 Tax=Enterovirga aerilata TaxID=2730920 RepID=A0A849I0R8_9HYPH|nr:efflux RND transporter periplasmic adaptor subunit [Enterovirga sp. DB1703]
MKRFLTALLILGIVAAGAAYVWRKELGLTFPGQQVAGQGQRPAGGPGGRRAGAMRGGEGPVSVLAEPARVADVPVILEAVGTAQALNTVTVRSQVDGRLVELAFREGQDVRKGDLLARIDPTIYQAQYDQAVAKKAQDEANLANARIDLERYVNLAKTNYGSKQQADTQRALVAQLEAQVKADQGAIDNAKAYLDYTTITAPIDGRTGIRLVDQGNLVRASDTTGIVVITQIKPIAVVFNLPQQNLRAVNAAAQKGPLVVEALESDNRTVIDRGRLEVVDNQVDQTTGTVKLKASFPNASLQLWPGSFVNVRLTVDVLRGVTVVPTAAVQRGPNGAFVYALDEDRAVLKPVTVGRQTETVAVIGSGIAPGERVITTGFARLTDGDRVRVAEGGSADAPATPPAMRRQRPDGEAGAPPRERRRRPEGQAGPVGASGPAPGGAAEGQATGSTEPAPESQRSPRPEDASQGRRPAAP